MEREAREKGKRGKRGKAKSGEMKRNTGRKRESKQDRPATVREEFENTYTYTHTLHALSSKRVCVCLCVVHVCMKRHGH